MKLSASELTRYVEGMRQGSERDFERIYNAFLPYAYFVVQKTYSNKNETEDIIQEAFIAAYKNIQDLKNPASFAAWFGKILNGAVTGAYRKRKIVPTDIDDQFSDTPEMKDDFQPESRFESKEDRRKVLDAISRLPDSQRRTVIAFYFQDLKITDIAESFQISEGAVKNALHKARLSLQKHLAPTFGATAFTVPLPFILWREYDNFSIKPATVSAIWKSVTGGAAKTTPVLKIISVLKTVSISQTIAVLITAGTVTGGISIAEQVMQPGEPVPAIVELTRADSLEDLLGKEDAALLTDLCAESSEGRDNELTSLLQRNNIAPDMQSRSLDGADRAESFILTRGMKRLCVVRRYGAYRVTYLFEPSDAPEITEEKILALLGDEK
ncbi:MAG: sigma-70 family RNA polymerase sigma factor [Clostridiales bacterium]|jgi:RNA polymerase sigma factor (sigma-70 family)|nr:sigma-70 family RNA polymerase sigma factor [Clostridiales bacterium]